MGGIKTMDEKGTHSKSWDEETRPSFLDKIRGFKKNDQYFLFSITTSLYNLSWERII